MNRRSFVLQSVSAILGLGLTQKLAALGAGSELVSNIGLQLYTLRNPLKENVVDTLKVVVAAGYKQVEPFGFPNADELIARSKDLGLKVNSTHFSPESVVEPKDASFSDFQKIVEKAASQGLTHLVVPYLKDSLRKNLDDYKKVAENLNKAGEKASAAGITLSYHNHSFEFKPLENGKSGYDIFVSDLEKAKLELDLFWVKVAGIDPAQLLEKLAGRVSQIHLKDLNKGIETPNYGSVPKEAFKEVGSGVIDTVAVLAAASKAGVIHAHVEQDQSPDALASVQQSAKYLKSL